MFFVDREFSFPESLAEAVSQSLWRCPRPTNIELDRVGRRLRQLWPLLAKERGQQDQNHYSFSLDSAEAYTAYYLPANALKIPLILEEMRLLGLQIPQDCTWLDIGSGPGTTMAGLAWWSEKRGTKIQLHNYEQSKLFIQRGESLQRALHEALPKAQLRSEWQLGDSRTLSEWAKGKRADIISFSNSIGEIAPTAAAKQKLVEELMSLRPRWIIFLEPASLLASRELLELRELLRKDKRYALSLPCFDSRPCGALGEAKDWCHEEASCKFPSWHNDLGALAGLQKQALLFSYLVVGVDQELALSPDIFRVVSQRLEQKGQTLCYLCTNSGKQKVRVQHSKKHEGNEYFLQIRRGEIFSHVMAAEKGDVISFVPGPKAVLDPGLFPL